MGNSNVDAYLLDVSGNSKSVKDEQSATDLRDQEYTLLVHSYTDHYAKKSETNRILKVIFFGFTLLLLGILIIGCIALAIIACIFIKEKIAVITTLVSSILGAVSSILILPTIICDYLFPKNEDKYIRDLIGHFKDTDKK